MFEEVKKRDVARDYIILYMDMVIRGLISFFVVGIGLYALLIFYFKMKFIYVLPIAFICSIFLSPFLSKVKLGEKLLILYERLLAKVFKLTIEENGI